MHTKYFTAFPSVELPYHRPGEAGRYLLWRRALQTIGNLLIVDGFYKRDDDRRDQDTRGKKRIEKQTDVNLAVEMMADPGKTRVHRTADGITFLGWRIFPARRRLVRANVVRFRRKIRALQRQYERGEIEWKEVAERVQAWNAHAAHGDTWKLRERIFSQYPFLRKPRGQNKS